MHLNNFFLGFMKVKKKKQKPAQIYFRFSVNIIKQNKNNKNISSESITVLSCIPGNAHFRCTICFQPGFEKC